MLNFKKTAFLSFIVPFVFAAFGQNQGNIPLGTWRIHTSFTSASCVAQVGNKIFCGTDGGLFYYDKEDNSLNVFSKKDGLADLIITTLYYHSATDALLIGYSSGNIDVYKNGRFINLPYIVNAGNIIGSKKINAATGYKERVILACDFGGVVVNMDRLEVQESWLNIGPNGSSLAMNDVAVNADSIFLATDKGLFKARLNTGNLMDFNLWKNDVIISTLPSASVNKIHFLNNSIVAALNGRGMYEKKEASWSTVYTTTGFFNDISSVGKRLLIIENNALKAIEATDTLNRNVANSPAPFFMLPDKDEANSLWFADLRNGLIKHDLSTGASGVFYPSGPNSNSAFAIKYIQGFIIHLSGSYDRVTTPLLKEGSYSFFNNGSWSVIGDLDAFGVKDLVSMAVDNTTGNIYYASAWRGLVERKNSDNSIAIYDDNSKTCPVHNTTYGVRVLDTWYDNEANTLWFVNNGSDLNPSINKFKNGNCTGYIFPFTGSKFPVQILKDKSGNMWVRLNQSQEPGMLVFNEGRLNGNVPIYRFLRSGAGAGNLTDNIVRGMAMDRNGDIWLCTNNGVSVYYNPQSLLQSTNLEASYPIFENRPLLFDQVTTCIDIDGGNRKWIGTGNGIYLFSPDGTRVVHYFNTDNSPLLSNNIISVAVQQQTGEVFIGTDKGIVSYREAATQADDNNTSMLIFPNPVKTNYSGFIGFSGLATDAVVKVTDASGRLVYETRANGGAAQWNGRDYNGKKIEPGVYVVLTAKDDGTTPTVGKLFVTD